MSIIDKLTPVYYYITRITFQRDETGALVVDSDIQILNADGQVLAVDHPKPTLTANERTAFLNWYNAKRTEYETAIGLTEWTPPPQGVK